MNSDDPNEFADYVWNKRRRTGKLTKLEKTNELTKETDKLIYKQYHPSIYDENNDDLGELIGQLSHELDTANITMKTTIEKYEIYTDDNVNLLKAISYSNK